MREIKSRAEQYLRRAAEFATMAEAASDPQAQLNYRGLAESYSKLSRKVLALSSATDGEIEELAQRMVQK
jgi:hypothetical protein